LTLHEEFSLRLFEACSYKPAPKGLPSSRAQHSVIRHVLDTMNQLHLNCLCRTNFSAYYPEYKMSQGGNVVNRLVTLALAALGLTTPASTHTRFRWASATTYRTRTPPSSRNAIWPTASAGWMAQRHAAQRPTPVRQTMRATGLSITRRARCSLTSISPKRMAGRTICSRPSKGRATRPISSCFQQPRRPRRPTTRRAISYRGRAEMSTDAPRRRRPRCP
jgi:hypothetical protein